MSEKRVNEYAIIFKQLRNNKAEAVDRPPVELYFKSRDDVFFPVEKNIICLPACPLPETGPPKTFSMVKFNSMTQTSPNALFKGRAKHQDPLRNLSLLSQ